MKQPILILFALALGVPVALGGGTGWQSDFDKAAKKARKADRPILVEFTDAEASKALNKSLFYTSKFKGWARKNVVLLEINFGKRLSDKVRANYEDLKKKFKVESFPTVLLVDHEGKLLGKPALKEGDGALEAWIADTTEMVAAASSAGTWVTDWDQAVKLAKRTRKPMLVDFNGSDW